MNTRISPASSLQITPLEERRLFEVLQFLAGVFGPDTPAELLDARAAHWKYFEPYPGWEGARSYVVDQADAIVAHASLWPTVFTCSIDAVRCGHILDWAGSRSAPGAGTAIYQHLMGLGDAAFVVGGSDQAKRLLPRMGFRLYGQQAFYARVVRPWKQFQSRPRSSLARELARLARNTIWSIGNVRWPQGWTVTPPAKAPDDIDSTWQPQSFCRGRRSSALVNYLLGCPVAVNQLHQIRHNGRNMGYFMLNSFGGQCRIVDLFLESEDRQAWQAAYQVAFLTAARIPGTCEVSAVASLPWLGSILAGLGFKLRQEKPIFLHDPKKRCAGLPPFLIQMVDSDAFFLHSPFYPFLT